MSYQTVNISLPKELIEKADRKAKEEYRNRSELIREALRVYIHGYTGHFADQAEDVLQLIQKQNQHILELDSEEQDDKNFINSNIKSFKHEEFV